jgi:hypothetical protein
MIPVFGDQILVSSKHLTITACISTSPTVSKAMDDVVGDDPGDPDEDDEDDPLVCTAFVGFLRKVSTHFFTRSSTIVQFCESARIGRSSAITLPCGS